jgi:biotin carboxylase
MRTIIFIGSSKSGSSREAIRAAERLGFYTVLFTKRKLDLEQRTEFPDVHELISIQLDDMTTMREKIKYLKKQGKIIEAIISFVDGHVYRAAILSEEFCNRSVSTEAILKMEDKIQTRNVLQNTPFNIKYAIYKGEPLSSFIEKHDLTFPIIIKSPYSAGSKDVLKAECESQLKTYVNKLTQKYPTVPILFEEYIDGPQYLVETLIYNNEINIVAIIEQEILKEPRFIVSGYSLLAKVDENLYKNISNTVISIIKNLGIKNGPCHLELRLHRNQWKLIEANPRISGGAMNRMIEVAYGINLAEQIIKIAVGEEPSLQKKHEKFVFAQYITLDSSGRLQQVTGKNRALRHEGVNEVFIKPKKETYLHPPLSMGHRYAYVIASAFTKEEAKKIAKAAAKEINFHLY